METEINKDVARKVLKTVDAGLTSGLGKSKPGQMCIEAAVCFALGLPHGDNPPCVGKNVRSFKIALNDCKWPSIKARTKGMRKLAIAQLGSDQIDQQEFLELVGFKCMTQVLPVILENSVKEDSNIPLVSKITKQLTECIEDLKSAKDFKSAKIAASKAKDIYRDNASAYAYASASAYASAYAYAYAYAYASAYASASASAYASASASASAYAYASASASASAYASAYAYAYAYAYASKNSKFYLKILTMTAQAGLDALIELKSPGCKWLDLCE